jgi:hypothetical protein
MKNMAAIIIDRSTLNLKNNCDLKLHKWYFHRHMALEELNYYG